MGHTIYENNDVEISSKRLDEYESEILVNGKNLIVISSETERRFQKRLSRNS